MAEKADARGKQAPSAENAEVRRLIDESSEDGLVALLADPRMDELHLCLLLERKDLSTHLLERVAGHKQWMGSYRVRLRLARHPHTPRRIAARLLRELYLFDLVAVSLLPSAPAEVRRLAEELILARLAQLPLGEKLTLARRGPPRVLGVLLGEGNARVVPLALDNPLLTEAQVLKVLAREGQAAGVVSAIARHAKWSCRRNVRLALIRHPLTPLACALSFLAELAPQDLRDVATLPGVPQNLRQYIRHELTRRSRRA